MRLKKLLFIFFLFSSLCYAGPYESVDYKVRNYPHFNSLEHLSIRIMNDFRSDTNRVRAASIWIIYKDLQAEYFQSMGGTHFQCQSAFRRLGWNV